MQPYLRPFLPLVAQGFWPLWRESIYWYKEPTSARDWATSSRKAERTNAVMLLSAASAGPAGAAWAASHSRHGRRGTITGGYKGGKERYGLL